MSQTQEKCFAGPADSAKHFLRHPDAVWTDLPGS